MREANKKTENLTISAVSNERHHICDQGAIC